jgi:hypothetical protein
MSLLTPEDTDEVLYNMARYLAEGKEEEALQVLLSCSLAVVLPKETERVEWEDGDWISAWVYRARLAGPRSAYNTLRDGSNPVTSAIQSAFSIVLRSRPLGLPSDAVVQFWLEPRYELQKIANADWRREVAGGADTSVVTNQGTPMKQVELRQWNYLKFRSESEVRIATALDRFQVLFLPNCMARMGISERFNREADFLVCLGGKWGILEVDGKPFHPAERTAEAHDRDRIFRAHGIKVVEHFDADDCFEDAEGVVKKFLYLLKQNG